MPDPVQEHYTTITLNGKQYEMVRQTGTPNGLVYERQLVNEAPWDRGALPRTISEVSSSWHEGGFKSRQGVDGTSEYGINTDTRWPFRLVPGPGITTLALPGNSSAVKHITKSPNIDSSTTSNDDIFWIVAGNRVYRTTSYLGLSIAAYGVYESASNPPLMVCYWQNNLYLATTDGTLYKYTGSTVNNVVPTGAGATTQFTPSVGANWQNVDDGFGASDNDGTYNSDSTTGHIDLFTKGALGYSAFDGILNVIVVITIRRTSTGSTDPQMRAVMRIGGVNYFATAQTLENSTSYRDYNFNFPTNPATGAPWTVATFDSATFGYELTVAPGAGAIRVTNCFIAFSKIDWTTVDAKAHWLAAGPRRLLKVYDNATTIDLKNLDPAYSPLTEANWADDVVIPGTDLTQCRIPLAAYRKTAIVATEQGVYGIDDDGTGIRIIERITYAPQTMAVQDPFLFISHSHGLSRWIPGLVEDCGIEQEIMNQGPVVGKMTALAFLGKWAFAAITPPTGYNQILVGRDRHSGEPGLGPMIWDTLINTGVSETINSLYVGKFYNIFILVFESTDGVGYCYFPESGGVPEVDFSGYLFATSGYRYTYKYRFGDWHSKDFLKFNIVCKGITANIYWSVAYSVDGGSYNTTDINGTTMQVLADGLSTFTLPTSANGREVQFRLQYTSNDSSAKAEVLSFEPFVVPQAQRTPSISVVLRLESYLRHNMSEEDRTVNTQLSDLNALAELATPILTSGPWGEDVYMYVKDVRVQHLYHVPVQMQQSGMDEPALVCEIDLQVRE